MADEIDIKDNHELFCREFAVDLNATRAAKVAGFSKKTAASQASRLLKNVKIQKRIAEILQKRFEKIEVRGEEVLRRLDNFSDFDPADAFDQESNTFKNIHDIPIHIRKCIESVQIDEIFEFDDGKKQKIGETVKVSFIKRTKPTELLGKNQKLFVDKVEIGPTDELAEVLRKARERAGK